MTPIISMTSINARDTVKTPAGASSWWQKETWLYSNIFLHVYRGELFILQWVRHGLYHYSCGLSTATIEYSCPVCVSVCVHDN